MVRELGIVCRLVLVHGLDVFAHQHLDLSPERIDAARETILSFFEEITAVSVEEYTRKQQTKHDALDRSCGPSRN